VHDLPVAHFSEHEPPQSTSVSSPFLTLSLQVAATHSPRQTPLWQSELTLQGLASAHGRQGPPQSM